MGKTEMTIKWSERGVMLKDLKDYDRNPRRMTKDQFKNLVKSLQEDGYHQRLMINTDNTIIGGHQRKKALIAAGYKPHDMVRVLVPDRLLEGDDLKRVNVRDNLPYGSFDFDMLTADCDIDSLLDWGMPQDWMPSLDDPESTPSVPEPIKPEEKVKSCPSCGYDF
jgi:hypothetical protein